MAELNTITMVRERERERESLYSLSVFTLLSKSRRKFLNSRILDSENKKAQMCPSHSLACVTTLYTVIERLKCFAMTLCSKQKLV